MDTDPLSDTVPPRYAIESDEEEDEFNPLSTHGKTVREAIEIKIKGADLSERSVSGGTLIVAAGEAGRAWARGADLEEQKGGVYVNDVQVGLVFKPSWTKATVLASEVNSTLPIWAMNQYAQTVLDFFKPSALSLLDTYPVPVYIISQVVPYQEAPIRYLSTTASAKPSSTKYQPYQPPNLIQSTSAAFLSIVYVSFASSTSMTTTTTANSPAPPIRATLLLLPSPHIPPARSSELPSSSLLYSDEGIRYANGDGDVWSRDTMQNVDETLAFELLGEKSNAGRRLWQNINKAGKGKAGLVGYGGSQSPKAGRRGDIGEGGMYI